MDSDEEPALTDPAEAAWVAAQRERVAEYLTAQNVVNAEVSVEPRWFVIPYVAIWAVRSRTDPDRVGWWAISGDLPTDYLTCRHERDDGDVLLSFARQWKAAAAEMVKGRQLPGYQIGPPGRERELAPLLLTRAELLEEFAGDLKRGDSAGDP